MTTYDLKMKKTIPSKEVLEQYIYDYGIDKTAQIFHISTEELDKKINWKPQYEQYSYNPAIAKPLSSYSFAVVHIFWLYRTVSLLIPERLLPLLYPVPFPNI